MHSTNESCPGALLGFTKDGRPIRLIAGGAPDPEPEPKPDPEPTPDAKPEPKFTQADVDRMIRERVARAKPADYDDVKAKAKEYDDFKAAQASDLEKALKAARDEERAAIAQQQGDLVKQWTGKLVASKAEALAATAGFRNPSVGVALLKGLSDVPVDDHGAVDTELLTGLLEKLGNDEPYLLANHQEQPPAPQKFPDLGQGKRDGQSKPSVASGREMFEARRAGRTT